MASKSATRKITRRDAVTLLGAGTVAGVLRPAPANARPEHPQCDKPAVVETFSRPTNGKMIVSYSCCDETRNAVLVGVAEAARLPTVRGKKHLKPLRDRLTTDRLEEYCFMVWGLSEEQAKRLYDDVPDRYRLKPSAPK